MGIFKAAAGSVGGMFADQWKEFFCCDSMTPDLLVAHATNKVTGRSANTKGTSDYISDGSVVAVNDGEAALVYGGGQILACWMEPGEHVFHSDVTSGIFGEQGVKGMATDAWERFGFGGDTPHASQRVFYVNMKEIVGNYLSMPSPIPVRIIDSVTGLNTDANLECSAVYSFRLCEPATFMKRIVGYIPDKYEVAEVIPQVESEMRAQLMACASALTQQAPLRMSELPSLIPSIQEALIERMNAYLMAERGMQLVTFNLITFNLTDSDKQRIVSLQMANVLKDPAMAAAYLTGARAEAMRLAAANEAGAGANVALLGYDARRRLSEVEKALPDWVCPNCGHLQAGKFCTECGTKTNGWYCSEGHYNVAGRKYCIECTEKAPDDAPSVTES